MMERHEVRRRLQDMADDGAQPDTDEAQDRAALAAAVLELLERQDEIVRALKAHRIGEATL